MCSISKVFINFWLSAASKKTMYLNFTEQGMKNMEKYLNKLE